MTSVKELEPAGTLPPGVRGAQRGELLLSIDELALAAPWASGACGVRIKWWGEPGDGTVLLPSQREALRRPHKNTSGSPLR